MAVPVGSHTAIVGPNGAGKSTVLRLFLGLLRPRCGRIALWGRGVETWGRRELARTVGVVSQEEPPRVPLSVRSFVELGRNPHVRPWAGLGLQDRRAVREALRRVELTELEDRSISELSGGELQRAKLGRALAQEPELLLLDEPTVHLDIGHEVRFFERIQKLVRQERITAVSVTHNLHLASRYAEMVVLLADGGVAAVGPAREVIRPEPVARAFGWPVEVVELGRLGVQVVPLAPGTQHGAEKEEET